MSQLTNLKNLDREQPARMLLKVKDTIEQAYEATTQRLENIEKLRAAIDRAQDTNAAADLQNRIAI